MPDEVQPDPLAEPPVVEPESPQPQAGQPEANYHIFLWPEPPGQPTYLCLLCPLANCTEAEIVAHVTEVHGVTPVPSPLAANPVLIDPETGLLTSQPRDARPEVHEQAESAPEPSLPHENAPS